MLPPSLNAVSERSATALSRLKIYLTSTMTQSPLNNLMLLHIHRERLDKLFLKLCINVFISLDEHRLQHFGFWLIDFIIIEILPLQKYSSPCNLINVCGFRSKIIRALRSHFYLQWTKKELPQPMLV